MNGEVLVVGQPLAGEHLVHHVDIGLDIQRLIGKERIEPLLVRDDGGVEHVVNALHALVQILSLHADAAHAVIGVEELDRGGEVVVHELFDLGDVGGILDRVLHDLVGDAHDLVDLLAHLDVLDGLIQPPHLGQRFVALLDDGVDLRAVALLLRLRALTGAARRLADPLRVGGAARGLLGHRGGWLRARLGSGVLLPGGLADEVGDCPGDPAYGEQAPEPIEREEGGENQPGDQETVYESQRRLAASSA